MDSWKKNRLPLKTKTTHQTSQSPVLISTSDREGCKPRPHPAAGAWQLLGEADSPVAQPAHHTKDNRSWASDSQPRTPSKVLRRKSSYLYFWLKYDFLWLRKVGFFQASEECLFMKGAYLPSPLDQHLGLATAGWQTLKDDVTCVPVLSLGQVRARAWA